MNQCIDNIRVGLTKIIEALGHYSQIGGVDPPYHKTDDAAIDACVQQIRRAVNTLEWQMREVFEVAGIDLPIGSGEVYGCQVRVSERMLISMSNQQVFDRVWKQVKANLRYIVSNQNKKPLNKKDLDNE